MAGAGEDILWAHHRRILLDTRCRDRRSELTSKPIATRRDVDNATGSPKDDTEMAISLLQNKGIQRVPGGNFPLPDDAFRVVKVLVPTL